MSRSLLLLTLFALAPAVAAAIPPVPRVVLPPEVHKPADGQPGEPEPADDPAAVAERIAKNAKALGDKLAGEDTGPDTLTGQEKLKKDIDSLIKALENPPPMSNQSNPMDNQQGNQGQQNQPMGGQQPMGGGQSRPQGGQRPMGNRSGQPQGGQRPMGGQGQQNQPMGNQQPMGGQPDGKPQPGQQADQPKGGNQAGGGGMAKPALPLDEAIARDFWGNLPDLPRQRMLQFFREQYMSRYKELLPQYYQSLAEKEKKGKK